MKQKKELKWLCKGAYQSRLMFIVGTQRDKSAIRTKIKRKVKRIENKRLSPDKRVVGTKL